MDVKHILSNFRPFSKKTTHEVIAPPARNHSEDFSTNERHKKKPKDDNISPDDENEAELPPHYGPTGEEEIPDNKQHKLDDKV